MSLRSTDEDWGSVLKAFHWSMALVILGMMILGWTAKSWPFSPLKVELFYWHKSIGTLILGLVLLRLVWRLTSRTTPRLPREMPPWERSLARLSHGALYLLMLAQPISGWAVSSASKVPFKVLGLWRLPQIVPPGKALEALAKGTHLTLFWIFAVVLTVHIAAALRHHYRLDDGVLRRMLPRRSTTGKESE